MKYILLLTLILSAPLLARDLELFNVETTYQSSAVLQPWRKQNKSQSVLGVPFGGRYLITILPLGDGRSALVKPVNSTRREVASLIKLDSELRLAVLRIGDIKESSDPANPVLPQKLFTNDLPPLFLDLKALPLKTALRTSGPGGIGHTVFYEGTAASDSPAGNAQIPVIRFSGFQKNIGPGHVLIHDGAVVGLISGFDIATGMGTAIPSALIEQFLAASGFDKNSPVKIELQAVDPDIFGPDREGTIVRSAGFRGRAQSEPAFLRYAGLVSEHPAVAVTQTVFVRTQERSLVQNDLILAVPGNEISVKGSVIDEYYGELPLALAMVLKNGRFTTETSATLSILRDREKREVSQPILPASESMNVVPPRFRTPSYLIAGGLVLLELSGAALPAMVTPPARLAFVRDRYLAGDNLSGERVVFVNEILPLDQNTGYSNGRRVLTAVNGIGIRNLNHAHGLVKDARRRGVDVVFTFEGNEIMVFSAERLAQADEMLRKKYSIPFLSGAPPE
ncbi:MAG: hypothetical protein K8S54_13245 [Spirochaetia bacterium]|nr:hypothetical protein [Spirochaetia bacterium]